MSASADIRAEQTRLLYTQAPPALAAGAVVAVVTALYLWPVVDRLWLGVWFGAVIGLMALRMALVVMFRRVQPPQDAMPRWDALFTLGQLLAGTAWGIAGLFLEFSASPAYQVFIIFVLAGVSAGAISSTASSFGTYLVFVLPTLIPAAAWLALRPHPNGLAMTTLVLVFGVMLVLTARNYSCTVARSLRLRLENLDLVAGLTASNAELEAEVHERKLAEEKLQQERRRFVQGPVTVFRWRAEEGWPIEYVSPNVSQFGLDADDVMGRAAAYADFICPEDLPYLLASGRSRRASATDTFVEQDYRLVLQDGTTRWVYDYTIPVHNAAGEVTHYDGYILDITDRKRAETALQEAKERAQVTLHCIGEAVITTDVTGVVSYLNPAAENLVGYTCDEARGRELSAILSLSNEETGEEIPDPVQRCLATGADASQAGLDVLVRPDGQRFAVKHSVAPMRDYDRCIIGAVLVFHDVTEMRAMARRLAYQASHDPLTGLINRREFERRLESALRTARGGQRHHVFFYMDLDQFKVVNDTCGHVAGDELLKQLGSTLQAKLRDTDTLARLGGDEFGVLLEGRSLDQARPVADKLRAAVKEFRFVWGTRLFEIGVSTGIVAITREHNSVGTVMSQADMACYAAKDLGRNRIHVYEPHDSELARRHSEMHWVSRITEALQQDRFVLYCQDIKPANPSDDDLEHIEVLLRMDDETGQLVSPTAFLSAAERYNLMPALDRWVVRSCFAWYGQRHTGTPVVLGINLSGTSLSDQTFLDYIRELLAEYSVAPSAVCFEVTETAAIADLNTASHFIRELKALGCRFALDDFGSGLSSFAYLKNLPVDYLKIDGWFVKGMATDATDRATVTAINQIGHAMGIRTIAERVENEAILAELKELGVDFVQGFHVGRPRPLIDRAGTAVAAAGLRA